ncbi:hypothetical protein CLU79DRAFT_830331 [Phycomyces nitens]|nr:hypothetical protein CLU79DRAFT_830331 [Phycomyces nitens]
MDLDLFRPHSQRRYVQSNQRALKKCCGCIHLRTGACISCVLWAGFSLYFAILSFQNKSPFFSYLPNGPIMAYGITNLVLALVSLWGLFAIFYDEPNFLRPFSHATWVGVMAVLIDGFVNVIIFITIHSDYQYWCIIDSGNSLITKFNAASITLTIPTEIRTLDLYNCGKLWDNEVKFSFIVNVFMIVIYVYWAACIHSLSHKRAAMRIKERNMMEYNGLLPGPLGPPLGLPPIPVIPYDPNSNVIILNNTRPRKQKSFSLRRLRPRRNSVHIETRLAHEAQIDRLRGRYARDQAREASLSGLDFKVEDGHVVDMGPVRKPVPILSRDV